MTAPFKLYKTDDEIAENAEQAHAPAIARGCKCRECPLWACERGPVLPQVIANSNLIVIGEAPGPNEVKEGRPFVGASGRILNGSLGAANQQREDTSVTNVILCQPPDDFISYLEKLRHQAHKNGTTAVLPTDCCRPRLVQDLADANATVELAVGGQALKAVANLHGVAYGKSQKVDQGQTRIAALRKQHGAPIVLSESPRKVLIASYHPAFAMRGAKAWMPVIKKVITRAAKIAKRGGEIDWIRPEFNIDPTIEEVEAFADMVIEKKAMMTGDIETDGAHTRTCNLRCVGMGVTIDNVETIIIVPVANMNGQLEAPCSKDAPFGPRTLEDLTNMATRAKIAVRRIMDCCSLAGQNFSFDTSVMLRLGFMTDWNKRWFDTMLAHHDTDSNDLPHDLGFIVSEEFEAPHHKDDADHSVVDNVDYPRLKTYNGDDVLTTMRLIKPLMNRIMTLGTVDQFKTDTLLAPICRDMGDLGLVIDERERQRLSVVLSEKRAYHLAQFRFEAACVSGPEDESERVKAALLDITNRDLKLADRHAEQLTIWRGYADRHGFGDFNPRSPIDMPEWLYEREGLTPQINTDGFDYDEEEGISPSCGQAALLKLHDKYPHIGDAVDAVLEYRAYDKLYGTYVADKKGRIRDVDWTDWDLPPCEYARILNTIYKLHIIPSGRLSTQPAIQNWPAVGKANMRTMVISPPGHCLVGADYDQVELRIYAVIAQDKLLLQAFAEGLDPHCLNAAALLSKNESEIMDQYWKVFNAPAKEKKYWRTVAKRFCYLETYGGEEEKLFSSMSASRNKATGKRDFPTLTLEEVLVWHERWHKLHPETKIWQFTCQRIAAELGQVGVRTLDYRKRHFPGGIAKKNAPVNHTIQAFAASIANRAMIKLAEAIPHRGWSKASGLCLQVHDYIGAYVPRERVWEAREIFNECMPYEFDGMPFTCTPEISERWSDQG